MLFKYLKAIKNRIVFYPRKLKFRKCGTRVIFESPFVLSGESYITAGDNIRTKPRLQLEAIDSLGNDKFTPEIMIGDDVSINYDVHIACINKVVIGKGVLIASKVFITDHGHGDTCIETLQIPPSKRKLYSKGPVIIEENVWIGEGVAVMAGVTIGKNSVIGANSVVTKDIPPFSVAVGTPARVIQTIGMY
ncbi:acyltransferase [Perspicuibacillus lycopersici]|uniref:acyltransferase n=1 Tax=Perspicuibacillus lycopersici TaxID=1325689 RepID=UPI0029557F76|nr:acyltransferase [Perspicuibacillus lycopersici]